MTAVVTGGSSGIGLALAHEFARRGYEVVIAAQEPVAGFESVTVDLTTADGVQALYEHVRERDITALALSAGISARSDDLERELALIDLNVRSTVHLARLLTPGMRVRIDAERGQVMVL